MIRNRSFLIGLGIGLMAGALLLQLMLVGERQREELNAFSNPPEEPKLYTQAEADKLIEDAIRDALEEAEAQAGERQPAAAAGDKAEMPAVKSSAPPDAKQSAALDVRKSGTSDRESPGTSDGVEPGRTAAEAAESGTDGSGGKTGTVVRIPPGSSVTETAAILAAKGLIAREEAFVAAMRKAKKVVRAGYFRFPDSPDLQEIIEIVSSQPLPPEEGKALLEP